MTVPSLLSYQSLWAMEDLPLGAAEPWLLEEQVAELVGAGYAGVAVDLGARRAPTAAAMAAAVRGSGLRTAVFAFAGTDDALAGALRYAAEIDAPDLVLCAQHYTLDLDEAASAAARWHAQAARAGVRLQLETHRNTMTNDLRFTAALADRLDPAVELAVDLSHYVVGAEIPAVPSEEVEACVARIVARAGSVQGRIATRCQVQVPLDLPTSEPWVQLARRWWGLAFDSLLARHPDAAEVVFVTELGTTPYALTDRRGAELSDRWAEAQQLRAWAQEELDLATARRSPHLA